MEVLSENEAVAQEGVYPFEMGLGRISYFGINGTEMGSKRLGHFSVLPVWNREREGAMQGEKGSAPRAILCIQVPWQNCPTLCAVIHGGQACI